MKKKDETIKGTLYGVPVTVTFKGNESKEESKYLLEEASRSHCEFCGSEFDEFRYAGEDITCPSCERVNEWWQD